MFGLVEVIGEALFQTLLQGYIIYVAYATVRSLSLYQFLTLISSLGMVLIHITRPLIPKKLRHGPEESIWFAIKRIYWPIALNIGIFTSFCLDITYTFYVFHGTQIDTVLTSAQLSYLFICMLLIWKNCLRTSRQTQLKFLMCCGMSLIWCAKFSFFSSSTIKDPFENQILPYENAIFSSLFALNNLIGFFLLTKSAFTLEQFSEFWDVDKILKSNFWSSMWIMLLLTTFLVFLLTSISPDPWDHSIITQSYYGLILRAPTFLVNTNSLLVIFENQPM